MLFRLTQILIFATLTAPFVASSIAWAGKGNSKLFVTDELDDDARAQIEALLSADIEIKGILISTGNVFLKAAVARKLFDSFGRNNVPVYIGTASDLSKSESTKFAHEITKYGAPLLSEAERLALATMAGRNGRGVAQLAVAMQNWEAPVDVILATSPVDFNAAVNIDFKRAQQVIADVYAMGFWTDSDRIPFNGAANEPAVHEFMQLYNRGLSTNFIHVPTYAIRGMKGTDNGYVAHGSAVHTRILRAMTSDPTLENLLKFGLEYRLSWMSKATGQFGVGFNDNDQWVPDTYRNVTDPSPFYLADMVPVLVSNLTETELATLQTKRTKVQTAVSEGKLTVRQTNDNSARLITEIVAFDVRDALDQHAHKLESWVIAKHPVAKLPIDPVAERIIPTLKNQASLADRINDQGPKTALFLTYKNSPDDALALLTLIAFRHGRESLANGAIITEGFAAAAQAQYLKGLLADFGINNIPIIVGREYQANEVRHIPNFIGEQFLHDSKQNLRAFNEYLVPRSSTASATLDTILNLRIQQGMNIDGIVLAEGGDYWTALSRLSASTRIQGRNYIMGGGRINQGAFVWTRNWLRDKQMTIEGISRAASRGFESDIYSSEQYSGALVAVINNKVTGGTAANTIHTLSGNIQIRPVRAVLNHWINWSRGFSYVANKDPNKGEFDPDTIVNVVNCGTNSLYMVEDWLRSNLDPTYRTDGNPKELTAMTGITNTTTRGIVSWLNRNNVTQNEEGLAKLTEIAIKQLVSFVSAGDLSRAVQSQGVFSDAANSAMHKINNETDDDSKDDCSSNF